jgi:hypothetical protein
MDHAWMNFFSLKKQYLIKINLKRFILNIQKSIN